MNYPTMILTTMNTTSHHLLLLFLTNIILLSTAKTQPRHRAQTPDPPLKSIYDSMTIDIPSSDYVIHDPSQIITYGNHQLIAVTGKAQEDGYDCGLETWWRPLGASGWNPGQCLLQTKPDWVLEDCPGNDGAYWAPELDFIEEEGKLTLLYSVSGGFDEDSSDSCVGVVRAEGGMDDSFPNEFTWVDQGFAVTCTYGDEFQIEQSVIDPSVFWGMGNDEGRLFLVTGGGTIIGTQLNSQTYNQINGNWFDPSDSSWVSLARGPWDGEEYQWVEAAYIYPNSDTGYYYLFVNWGQCCRGLDSTYEIRVGRSSNPIGPYTDKNGVDFMEGGGSRLLKGGTGSLDYIIGPGHAGIWTDSKNRNWLSHHYYDGRREDGLAWITERRLEWDDEGWPRITGSPKNVFQLCRLFRFKFNVR